MNNNNPLFNCETFSSFSRFYALSCIVVSDDEIITAVKSISLLCPVYCGRKCDIIKF